ncbi:hypothetical protein LPB138_06925 [Urechidicola croceus]|uniref:Lipocalin-like domain-containing protein n=2 Tax=Urechidicola croceus TaxID=1850246 RepID=A0A1D8P774_9FLAO|nr:hypothetical protein LPB138_06925 [Urechidicola croceus]
MKITFSNDSIYDVPEGKWEQILKIKPIKTTYNIDKTYHSEYRDLDNKVVHTSAGRWEIKGDSIFLTSDNITTSYYFKYKNKTAEFTGMLDWNQDGKPHELYYGKQKKE